MFTERLVSTNLKFAIAVGLLLIAFGMLMPGPEVEDQEHHLRGRADVRAGAVASDETRAERANGAQRTGPRRAARGEPSRPADSSAVPLRLRFVSKATGEPASGARVGLWRSAIGQGPAYRPAKRVTSDKAADDEGRARFEAPLGIPLEVVAKTADGGKIERVVLGALERAPKETLVVELEPPPRPLKIVVRDDQGAPVPGASIWLVRASGGRPPAAEFPTGGTLVARTDGRGNGTLEGEVREAAWILVDAAGFGPRAVPKKEFRALEELALTVVPDADVEVELRGLKSKPIDGAKLELEFSLSGYRAMRTKSLNPRGKCTLTGIPAGVRLRPVLLVDGALAGRFATFEVEPGETRELVLEIE